MCSRDFGQLISISNRNGLLFDESGILTQITKVEMTLVPENTFYPTLSDFFLPIHSGSFTL